MTSFFITGTDTDIGKTFVTGALALAFSTLGYKVGVFKPLQSGAIETDERLLAPDVEAIKKLSPKIKTGYSYLLKGEVSPALAAKLAGVKISLEKIKADFENFSKELDITLVEGAGGVCAPAGNDALVGDLIKKLNISTILVTGAYLGTINHTLLSIKYLQSLDIDIKGVIINNFPTTTEDVAVQNMEAELAEFTNTQILSKIPKFSEVSNEKLVAVFKDCANRLIC